MKFWKKRNAEQDAAPVEADPRATNFRDDARIYALRGDNVWGHSITWSTAPGDRDLDVNHGRIVGWLSHKPRKGDVLAVAMASGKWGKWLIEKVDHCGDPHDMFFADVAGAYDYLDEADVPKSAYNGNGLVGAAADYV